MREDIVGPRPRARQARCRCMSGATGNLPARLEQRFAVFNGVAAMRRRRFAALSGVAALRARAFPFPRLLRRGLGTTAPHSMAQRLRMDTLAMRITADAATELLVPIHD
eukprot:1746579-Pyramimonas_sp.AAC.2